MYNSQEIAFRIKAQAKLSDVKMKTMLSDLGLGINIVSHLAKGQDMSYCNLAKIADYLDCSIDYLLGRTDNLNAHKTLTNSVNSVTSNKSTLDEHLDKESTLTTEQQELLNIFSRLSEKDRIKVTERALSLLENEKSV